MVTRGLLELLERRELEGVIAHELSHIGNQDIGLTTTLAALVGTLSLPLRLICAPYGFVLILALGVIVGESFIREVLHEFRNMTGRDESLALYLGLMEVESPPAIPFYLWWLRLHAMIAPFYAVFIAPVAGLLIRQAVSREREFLADADAALLTRDPESLALALVKIGAAGGEQLRVGEGTVHLYFVDPRSKGSWLHALFPSHPSLEKRVQLLARMGNGIAPSAIEAARDAGARFRPTTSVPSGNQAAT